MPETKLKVPENAEVFEGELATFWFDENGILYAIAKSTHRTVERQKENYQFVRQICGNKKVCLLSDTTIAGYQDQKTRDYSASELPNVFKAMAVISSSVAGEINAKLFLVFKESPIPIKFFDAEKEARQWLKQYL